MKSKKPISDLADFCMEIQEGTTGKIKRIESPMDYDNYIRSSFATN